MRREQPSQSWYQFVTGIGSQYLLASVDADKNYFDGSKTCRVTLPKGFRKRTSGR